MLYLNAEVNLQYWLDKLLEVNKSPDENNIQGAILKLKKIVLQAKQINIFLD